jgi:tetratricopeptide (TPR) repeat protein
LFWLAALLTGFLLALSPAAPALAGYYYMSRGAQTLAIAERTTLSSGELKRATADLERAARWLPADPLPLRRLARAYLLANRTDEAVAVLERARALQPDSPLLHAELVAAYEAAGQPDDAATLSRDAGLTPEQLVGVADQYMEVGRYIEAMSWYDRAVTEQPELGSPTALRRAIAAIGAGDTRANALVAEAERADPGFEVADLDEQLLLSGGQLRWFSAVGSEITYGTSLAYPYGGQEGHFWWDGRGGTLVQVRDGGRYTLEISLRHNPPAPVIMAVGVDGAPLARIELARGDSSWETLSLTVELRPGIHSIDLWFLNNDTVDGTDRNASVEWLVLSAND